MLIIPGLVCTAQKTRSKVWAKQLPIEKVTYNGFETEVPVPADFVKRELWRQTKTIAAVETIGELLRMRLSIDGAELVVYGQTLSVEDGTSFLSVVTRTENVEDYLKGFLRSLRQRILVAHHQEQIDDLAAQIQVIGTALASRDSRSEASAQDLWKEHDLLQGKIDSLRKAQRDLLR